MASRQLVGTAPYSVDDVKTGPWLGDSVDANAKEEPGLLIVLKASGNEVEYVDYTAKADTPDPKQVLILRKTSKYIVGNISDGKTPASYFWAIGKRTGTGGFIFWIPNIDAFQKLITEGKLHGVVTKDGGTIDAPPEALQALIDGPEAGGLFEWEHPYLLRPAG